MSIRTVIRYVCYQRVILLLLLVARDGASFTLVKLNSQAASIQSRLVSFQADNHQFTRNIDGSRWRWQKQSRKLSPSALSLLLDVPDDFFTITFPMLGILLSISKNFARIRMEERAWEQRLEDGREEYLRRNPSVTEYDLRKKEAAQEWSAYGVPRQQEKAATAAAQHQQQQQERYDNGESWQNYDRRRNRVSVMDRDDSDDGIGATKKQQRVRKEEYCMTDDEIEQFEDEYGVVYDPYYDDPYYMEELPDGKYDVDNIYGDRIYSNGEIFYKDGKTGLFYRQGSKPRNLSFFG